MWFGGSRVAFHAAFEVEAQGEGRRGRIAGAFAVGVGAARAEGRVVVAGDTLPVLQWLVTVKAIENWIFRFSKPKPSQF